MYTRFTLHCIDRFPLVIFQPELVQRCDASVWIREMEALIDRRKPFIVISPSSFHKESCEYFHLRRKWVMRHRLLLATYCRAFVSIEPNVKRKDEMSAMALGFAMTFGIAQFLVSNELEAERLAASLLETPALTEPPC